MNSQNTRFIEALSESLHFPQKTTTNRKLNDSDSVTQA